MQSWVTRIMIFIKKNFRIPYKLTYKQILYNNNFFFIIFMRFQRPNNDNSEYGFLVYLFLIKCIAQIIVVYIIIIPFYSSYKSKVMILCFITFTINVISMIASYIIVSCGRTSVRFGVDYRKCQYCRQDTFNQCISYKIKSVYRFFIISYLSFNAFQIFTSLVPILMYLRDINSFNIHLLQSISKLKDTIYFPLLLFVQIIICFGFFAYSLYDLIFEWHRIIIIQNKYKNLNRIFNQDMQLNKNQQLGNGNGQNNEGIKTGVFFEEEEIQRK